MPIHRWRQKAFLCLCLLWKNLWPMWTLPAAVVVTGSCESPAYVQNHFRVVSLHSLDSDTQQVLYWISTVVCATIQLQYDLQVKIYCTTVVVLMVTESFLPTISQCLNGVYYAIFSLFIWESSRMTPWCPFTPLLIPW